MSDGLLATLLLIAFLAATALGSALKPRLAWIPITLLALACFVGFLELARYDHGHADLLTWVGFVGAPVAAILGGAAWGTRRFYGWPDLGPHPSRLGLVAGAILLGVLVGSRVREQDIAESQTRAQALRSSWRLGQPFVGLPAAKADFPSSFEFPVRTRMGLISPPPIRWSRDAKGRERISFPISSRSALVLGMDDGRWSREERGRDGIP